MPQTNLTTPDGRRLRTRRLPGQTHGQSLYAVEALGPPPTFAKGDGYDSGRNLLGALLIGPEWTTVGYVLGTRGTWRAYTNRQWWAHRGNRSAPVSQWSPQLTVESAAYAVRAMLSEDREAVTA